ncbi:MAG: hypothetical protein HRT72_08535 [Flavobacteriales bacterium]|nr:hypothetical protein [Flavobacteriales bacterium]
MKEIEKLKFRLEAQKCANDLNVFTDKHPYINNAFFLKELKKQYVKLELFELAEIIRKRLEIIKGIKEIAFKRLVALQLKSKDETSYLN